MEQDTLQIWIYLILSPYTLGIYMISMHAEQSLLFWDTMCSLRYF